MADYAVYRFIENAPNSMRGAWIEEGIARDLKADQADEALAQCADPKHPDAKRRVTRWDMTEEFGAKPGPMTFERQEKASV